MSPEEKQEIINEVTERLLLTLPDVIGNLIINHLTMIRINKKFYEDYPDLKGNKDVVASVIEMVQGKNPTADYDDVIVKAIPEIKKRLSLKLDTKVRDNPNRTLSDHGEL